MKLCIVCQWRPQRANQRCHACDTYRKRNGHDRPEHLVVAHGQRLLDRTRR